MSGQDSKFQIMDEAEIKYKRFQSLLKRAPALPSLPLELVTTMEAYKGKGPIASSLDFVNALSKYWREISLPDGLKSELKRIAGWTECLWAYDDEVRAQLSADCLHLCC